MKTCKDCKTEKPYSSFYTYGGGRWYRGRCKKCHNLKFRPPKGINTGCFKKGNTPWNKGLRNTEFKPTNGFTKGHTRTKGIKKSAEHVRKMKATKYARSISRHCKKHRDWKHAVWERDDYKCVKCGSIEKICAHHIKPWKEYPELRFDIDNGLTLCCSCHTILHCKGRMLTDEHRKKLSDAHKGKKLSMEHRKNISKSLRAFYGS